MTTSAATLTTVIGTCPLDGTVTSAAVDLETFASRQNLGLITGSCGHRHSAKAIRAKAGTRECGAWCWDGVGRSCTCQCGGKNHGTTYAHLGATGRD